MSSTEYITSDTSKRLIRDIKDLYKNPLIDEGIYYTHDDTNMLKGYAMIIGPKDTPYEYGIYLFTFHFPSNYPSSPPKLIFKTVDLDGNTRFNPNLYRNGKVCLSILNTWYGDSWSSCQTIRSILMTLITILNENPLLNEPGVNENNMFIKAYNDIIRFKNLKCAIVEMGLERTLPNEFKHFFNDIREHLIKNKDIIINNINKMLDFEGRVIETGIYSNMKCKFYIKELLENTHKMYEQIENNK